MSNHISANRGDFAKVVLMPGDPLRAKWLAETFLENPRLVNEVRGILAYTGEYRGKKISVMASGMGIPSIGIYAHELYESYDVEAIIRIGTAGAYQKEIKLKDLMLAQGACTDSNFMSQYGLAGTYSAIASYPLLESAVKHSRELKTPYHVGNILSSDIFYDHNPKSWEKWAGLGILGVDMESYALYAIAAEMKKKALAILSTSNSFLSTLELSKEERQSGLEEMAKIALETAFDFA